MTLQAPPLHTASLRCVSQTSNPLVRDTHIEQRSPQRRVVNGIFGCVLCIASAILAGCGDSLGRDDSSSTNGIGGGDWFGTPVQPGTLIEEPSPPPAEPSVPPQEPVAPVQPPIASPPPSDPIQEPVEPIQEPSPPPAEPSVPPQEPVDPIPVPSPVVQCGSGMAALDMTGQCRGVSPTPGALEANDGTSLAGASVVSLAVVNSASSSLQVSWQPFGNNTAGYMVYYGATADTVNALVSDLALSSGLYDASAPSVTYDSTRDLGMYTGDTACFRIHAYDTARTTVGQVYLACRTI